MSSDPTFEPEVDVNGTTPPAALTATQSLARVFMAEGNGRYTVILPDSSTALALKSGATDGTERGKTTKPVKGGKPARGGKAKPVRGGGATFSGMGRVGCGGVGRCNGSCLDRGGKTCNGGVRGSVEADGDSEATPKPDAKKNRVLVDLHSAFHNTVRVARHSVVLVDLAKAPESLKKGSRVVGTIVNVVRNPEDWVQAPYWPYAPPAAPAKTKTDDSVVGLMPPSDEEDSDEE